MDVIKRVQELREKKGYSIYKLAKEANMPYNSITNMIKKGTIPTVYTLEKICNGLDISLTQFFSEDEETYALTDNQKLMLELFDSLSHDDQKYLLAYAMGLAKYHIE